MYLVTGGAGFIGSRLIDRLIERDEAVVCLDDFNDSYDPDIKWRNIRAHEGHPLFTLVEGDIRDETRLTSLFQTYRITRIIHLAARLGVRTSVHEPRIYEEVNIRGTLNLLEEARKREVRQFIFASSSSVYGNPARMPLREQDRLGPLSPYAATKHSGEVLCSAYHEMYRIPTTVLRFFSVYGPRMRPDM